MLKFLFGFWLGLMIGLPTPCHAGDWQGHPKQIQKWFQELMQPDNPLVSCCGEGDAVEADLFERDDANEITIAIVTDGKGIIADGAKVIVPNRKVKWDQGNPTGHGVLFLSSSNYAICYVYPAGA